MKNRHFLATRKLVFALLLLGGGTLFNGWPVPAWSQATQVDIATDATDPSNLPDNEPSIAVNPANPLQIVVVTFSEGFGVGIGAPVWKSDDGGVTWRKILQIPQPLPGLSGPLDQKIAFDASGKLYVAEIGGFPISDFVYRQTGAYDASLTAGIAYGDDQPHLDIDKVNTSGCFNRLYSPWLNTSIGNFQSKVSNSTTGGVAMTDETVGDNSVFPDRTTRIALAADGKAYVIYKTREGFTSPNFENAHFHVRRSDDCGATWNAIGPLPGISVHGAGAVQTWFTNTFGNVAKGKVARARSSDAWIAVNPTSGDVYAAYVSKDASGFGQIYVARSTTLGTSWLPPVRITDGTHHSAYPEIAVTTNGSVGVLYIDYDDSGAHTLFRHRFARSFDNGGTWHDEILQSMDPSTLLPSSAPDGFLWGDYEGLTAAGKTFYGVYTGQSMGRATVQQDPIFFKETGVPTPPPVFKRWVASFHAGGTIPHNNLSSFSSSVSLGADLEYRLSTTVSLETYLGYDRFSSHVGGLPDFWFVNLSERLKATFGTGMVRPFVFAGLGPYFGQSGGTHLGVNTGGGLQDWLTPKFAIEGSYTFHTVFTPVSNTRYSTLLAGVRFTF